MNKTIIVVVLLAVAAAIGLPPIVGSRAESTLHAQIEQMDENPMFAMRIAEYERGWFSSQAQVEITFDERYAELLSAGNDTAVAELPQGLNQTISVPVDLAHGPIAMLDGPYLGWLRMRAVLDERDAVIAEAIDELGLDYLAQLQGRVSFLGTFSFDGHVPPIEYLDESGRFSFSGVTAEGTLRNANLIAQGEMASLQMDSAGTAVTVENVSMNSDTTRINHLLWAGEFDANIDNMTIVDTLAGAGGATELNGLKMSGGAELDESGELLQMEASYAADRILLPAGDGEITDAELSMALENISVEGLTDYYEISLAFDPENPLEMTNALSDVVARILQRNPALTLDPIRFALDGEPLNAAVSLNTVGADQGGLDLTNMFVMLGLIEAAVDLTATKTLVHRLAGQAAAAQMGSVDPADLPPGQDIESMATANAEVMIIGLLGQGFIADDGDNYTATIDYSNGELLINGMPLPLGAFL